MVAPLTKCALSTFVSTQPLSTFPSPNVPNVELSLVYWASHKIRIMGLPSPKLLLEVRLLQLHIVLVIVPHTACLYQ